MIVPSYILNFRCSLLLSFLLMGCVFGVDEAPVYGVDISYPMHHSNVSNNYAWLPHNVDPSIETPDEYKNMPVQPLGDKQTFYDDLIQGCVDHYGERGSYCLSNERDRIHMSLNQPQGMHNYTKLGYTKIRAPDHVFKLIREFWEANRDKEKVERWGAGNTYTNHWASPNYMVNVEDKTLFGGGYVLKQHIWNAARDTISEWTGQQLAQCSLYGIRVYKEGAVLATHVDRLPLVSSAIINVDQDVDEPWPLEVIGHDGIATNVTMLPGDLVLYESHSVLHGRPFPLKGRFMANVFIHFEPIGPVGADVKIDPTLPSYVVRGSKQELEWKRYNPKGYKVTTSQDLPTGHTNVHMLAMRGDPDQLRALMKTEGALINARDENGWSPLHEAIRSGRTESIEILVEHGADINARTKSSETSFSGGSALWWAKHFHGEDHDVVQLLQNMGAKSFGPGDTDEL